MKNKEEIKQEIYKLAKQISETSSEDALLESARELYEKTILLKYLPAETETKEVPVETNKKETIKTESQPVAVDLFSAEISHIETISAPSPEKIVAKEPTKTKNKSSESVSEKLQHKKISDLKASIGINEKFQFINELFEGNMKEYNVAIDQINNFSSGSEAESYLANLREVYKWNEENPIAVNFLELVERRFA